MTDKVIKTFFTRYAGQNNQGINRSYYLQGTQLDINLFANLTRYQKYFQAGKNVNKRNLNQPAGILNYDNNCFVNIIFQILFHIPQIRKQIYQSKPGNSFLDELRLFFGQLELSKLLYIDPIQLLNILERKYSQTFAKGIQNDYYSAMLVLLKELGNEIKLESVQNIFKTKYKVVEKSSDKTNGRTIIKDTSILHIDVSYKNIETGMKKLYFNKVSTLMSSKTSIQIQQKTTFINFAPILIFYLSRTKFKNGQFIKNMEEFQLQETISMKKQDSESSGIQKSKERFKQIQLFRIQIAQKYNQKLNAVNKLLNYEQILSALDDNQLRKQALQKNKEVLKTLKQQMYNLDKQLTRLESESSSIILERKQKKYLLWAVVLHIGNSRGQGHYKVCIKNDKSEWYQCNDDQITKINYQKVLEYNKLGYTLSMLYRQQNFLINNSSHFPIAQNLKIQIEKATSKVQKMIDDAQIINKLLDQEQNCQAQLAQQYLTLHQEKKDQAFYYFSSVFYLLTLKTSNTSCCRALLYQKIKLTQFKDEISNLCVYYKNYQQLKQQLPFIDTYIKISKKFKQFLILEVTYQINQAYDKFLDILNNQNPNNDAKEYFNYVCQVITLKGIFYLYLFTHIKVKAIVQPLKKTISNILQRLLIQQNIKQLYKSLCQLPNVDQEFKLNIKIEYSHNALLKQVFEQRFINWIQLRDDINKSNINKLDIEQVFNTTMGIYAEYFQSYMSY